MVDLMDTLYSYAQDHEIAALLAQHDEYHESMRCVQGQEKRIRAMSGEAANSLDGMLEEQRLSQRYREKICFRAGFRMALELMRW